MADNKATLTLPGQEAYEMPIMSGTAGHDVIDVRTLGKKDISLLIQVS